MMRRPLQSFPPGAGRSWRRLVGAAALALAAASSLATETAKVPTVLIDGWAGGRTFDGIGALSAGASTRLLYDYPEPERSQILDYLFKPDYGASLQILKVEIGGDSNSTSGAEPSHMRSPDDLNGERGYEWWLMKEAKARNPAIKLWALEWCVPGWFKGGFWSDDNITYLLAWLRLAEKQGLKIDYVGGWNERGFNPEWYVKWHAALAKNFPGIKVVGSDDIRNPWEVVAEMRRNPAFHEAVDIVGVHDPSVQRTEYEHCPVPPEVLALDRKIWTSEQSSEGHDVGAAPLARAMNRQYIDARITANIVWSLISAWYANLPIADTGLMLAEAPWSGHYRVGRSIWVHAHTAQFTDIGWQYLDGACGYLPGGTSYVTLKSPDEKDFTVVLETLDTRQVQPVRFDTIGRFSTLPMQVWSTDLRSANPADHFVLQQTIQRPEAGAFTVELQPGHVYTLSTRMGHKGDARPRAGAAEQMTLPYHEDFESYAGPGKLARFYSDLEGAFETAPNGGGRGGFGYRQQITAKPVGWNRNLLPPTTLLGDPRWWGDYEVGADALLEGGGHVELLGRVAGQRGTAVAGYHLQFRQDGRWRLYNQELHGKDVVLAEGASDFRAEAWHRLGLRFLGTEIGVLLDGKVLQTVRSDLQTSGQAGLATSQWQHAQFDNVDVRATAPWPHFLPQSALTATATTAHAANHRGYTYEAANAIDDRPETAWSAEWEPRAPLPQALTIDLGASQTVQGLACQPRLEAGGTGMITTYRVQVSTDGRDFTEVARGKWTATSSVKLAGWPAAAARYVRLEVLETSGGAPRVGELSIATTPLFVNP